MPIEWLKTPDLQALSLRKRCHVITETSPGEPIRHACDQKCRSPRTACAVPGPRRTYPRTPRPGSSSSSLAAGAAACSSLPGVVAVASNGTPAIAVLNDVAGRLCRVLSERASPAPGDPPLKMGKRASWCASPAATAHVWVHLDEGCAADTP